MGAKTEPALEVPIGEEEVEEASTARGEVIGEEALDVLELDGGGVVVLDVQAAADVVLDHAGVVVEDEAGGDHDHADVVVVSADDHHGASLLVVHPGAAEVVGVQASCAAAVVVASAAGAQEVAGAVHPPSAVSDHGVYWPLSYVAVAIVAVSYERDSRGQIGEEM